MVVASRWIDLNEFNFAAFSNKSYLLQNVFSIKEKEYHD